VSEPQCRLGVRIVAAGRMPLREIFHRASECDVVHCLGIDPSQSTLQGQANDAGRGIEVVAHCHRDGADRPPVGQPRQHRKVVPHRCTQEVADRGPARRDACRPLALDRYRGRCVAQHAEHGAEAVGARRLGGGDRTGEVFPGIPAGGRAQMVAGVAHEINTPLGTVNTATSVVKGRLNAPVFAPLAGDPKASAAIEDVREAIDLIEGNIRRAHKLVQDFKQLSVGQIRDTKEMLDLVAVVEEVVGLFKINARQANLTIEIRNDLPDAAARAWLGYRGYLSQVLLNLLSNIERYAYPDGQGGRVEIAVAADSRRTDERFVITVSDFGRGIAADDLPRIFEPFFTTGRSKGGTGADDAPTSH
jgi:Histidine kinase-, DNA gyrase B-, and HSP90-like ATPase/His Kinase A (phospho-acceptor) domain